MTVDLNAKIPNNVDLANDRKLQRALEKWQPSFIDWWKEMGPEGFQQDDIYLRTAISVDKDGWAHFDYVKMPDYRWGIFLNPAEQERRIAFGDHMGESAWNDVPGDVRSELRRIIVTQGDTEPASVEQQRLLGQCAPSLYDLRNLFQVNVEEGRHLWAMVYLLHRYFGRDGRDEADDLLVRRSGHQDTPRILGAFNEPVQDWLDFFCFTTFTDRDGKFQLAALAESAFDPLARTTQFMLTEEAHHMFVGETGVGRVLQRTAELMKSAPAEDVRRSGAIPLDIVQKYINNWFSVSMDLFGGEDSSNAANYFGQSLKGRYNEAKSVNYPDHTALEGVYNLAVPDPDTGALSNKEIALRRAMNLVLRDSYEEECRRTVERWSKILEKHGLSERVIVPSMRFNRAQGVYSNHRFDLEGNLLTQAQWDARKDDYLPSAADRAYVKSLMVPVSERGKMANWIAPPKKGVGGQEVDFEYVRFAARN